jgi:hypothetical protein
MATLYSREHEYHRPNIIGDIEYVISLKGEVIPFQWIARMSTNPFDNIDQFADTLAREHIPNPMNELYTILDDGSICILDLVNAEFTMHMGNMTSGAYLPTDQIKRILMQQFARTNKGLPNGRNKERATCNIEVDGTIQGNNETAS